MYTGLKHLPAQEKKNVLGRGRKGVTFKWKHEIHPSKTNILEK